MPIDNLKWLLKWYHHQCDGDWEHEYGITIETVDNPGWYVVINLLDTDCEGKDFPSVTKKVDEQNWYFCLLRNNNFEASCGPCNLLTVLQIFREWTETCRQ